METKQKFERFMFLMGISLVLELVGIFFDWLLFSHGVGLPIGNTTVISIALPFEVSGIVLLAYAMWNYSHNATSVIIAIFSIVFILFLETVEPFIGQGIMASLFGAVL